MRGVSEKQVSRSSRDDNVDQTLWFQGQRMFLGFGLGRIAERAVNRFAFEPVLKLVGVMLAAGLAGLSGGDEDDGMIPVGKIGDKAFRRAMAAAGGTWAENRAGLRPIAKT